MLARFKSDQKRCPYCQSSMHQRLQSKWLIIEARKCVYCGLIFRYPTDSNDGARTFYERDYFGQQATGLPSQELIAQLKEANFSNSQYNKAHRIQFLRSICPNGRLLDFGCSWGYAVHQLKQAGYNAIGFELARNRAEFGQRFLGMDIRSDWEPLMIDCRSSFDVVYADHVLEHVSDLRTPLERFSELLKPSGLLVIFVPNAGGLIGRRLGLRWKAMLGEAHTIAFTDSWFLQNLPRHGFSVDSLSSYLDGPESLCDGEELICVARRNNSLKQISNLSGTQCAALSVG